MAKAAIIRSVAKPRKTKSPAKRSKSPAKRSKTPKKAGPIKRSVQSNKLKPATQGMKRTRKTSPAKKDKERVKRAMGAFMHFTRENSKSVRSRLQKTNPDAGVTHAAKELGRMWRAMSDEEKAPYNRLAEKSKAESATKRAALKKKLKAAKDAARKASGKGPVKENQYLIFSAQHRNDSHLEGLSQKDKMRKMGEMWQNYKKAHNME
jgi:high mobility group protein B1